MLNSLDLTIGYVIDFTADEGTIRQPGHFTFFQHAKRAADTWREGVVTTPFTNARYTVVYILGEGEEEPVYLTEVIPQKVHTPTTTELIELFILQHKITGNPYRVRSGNADALHVYSSCWHVDLRGEAGYAEMWAYSGAYDEELPLAAALWLFADEYRSWSWMDEYSRWIRENEDYSIQLGEETCRLMHDYAKTVGNALVAALGRECCEQLEYLVTNHRLPPEGMSW